MNDLLAHQLDEVLGEAARRPHGLACEGQLRAAAGTVSHARRSEIRATTVVGVLGADDRPALDALIADIAYEHDLEVFVHHQLGSFSVRFTRRQPVRT